MGSGDGESFVGVGSDQDGVTIHLEGGADEVADIVVVLHQENGFGAAAGGRIFDNGFGLG
jgi:hypothetical protein